MSIGKALAIAATWAGVIGIGVLAHASGHLNGLGIILLVIVALLATPN